MIKPKSKCCQSIPEWEDKDGNELGLTIYYPEKTHAKWTGMFGKCSKCNKKSEFLIDGKSMSNIVFN